jgi:hypothetical protein
MSTAPGIYSINDLLLVKNASATEFGVDHIAATVQAETSYTNTYINEMLADLAQPTVKQIEVWGGNSATLMDEVDELGGSLPQKQVVGINAAAPLRRFTQKLGWTQKYFEIATPAEMATEYLALRKGYLLQIQRQVKKAIFNNVRADFVDRLYNGVTLTNVYSFINADSTTLPDSPAGVSFSGASHDHYDGEATLTHEFIQALVDDVTEHGNTKGLKLFIALADVEHYMAFDAGFTPLPDEATQTLLTQLVSGKTLNNSDLENRQIGMWSGGIPVFVKPFMIEHYHLCVATGMPEKALLYRQRPQASLQGWRIGSPLKEYPLVADFAEAEFGFAAYNRVMAAVLYDANATYAVPTIT